MKIELTRGYSTEVDTEDFELLSQWKWMYGANGYAVRDEYLGKVDGKYQHRTVLMHRVILDAPNGLDIDHINHNKLDNRRKNLRIATRSQNRANVGTRRRLHGELPMGVTYNTSVRGKQPYGARVCQNGKSYFLGYFYTLEAAREAYLLKKRELFGEFADAA